MADEEQLRILKQGVVAWNEWRRQAGNIQINLIRANLTLANLQGADLRRADLDRATLASAMLVGADFHEASLCGADLRGAYLQEADLRGAKLNEANLDLADLRGAKLNGANLCDATFSEVRLEGADLALAYLHETAISNVDLSGCKNLDSIRHLGPSLIDIRTLQRSGHLPLAFLRGVGFPDALIEYLPSLLGQAIQHYSCFISYASADEAFARRLHADLQDKGVRCWFAPEDMKIGAKILDMALLSNFGPVVLMDFGPPPDPQPTVARADRGAWRGLESQSGFVRATTSGT